MISNVKSKAITTYKIHIGIFLFAKKNKNNVEIKTCKVSQIEFDIISIVFSFTITYDKFVEEQKTPETNIISGIELNSLFPL